MEKMSVPVNICGSIFQGFWSAMNVLVNVGLCSSAFHSGIK